MPAGAGEDVGAARNAAVLVLPESPGDENALGPILLEVSKTREA